MKLHGYLISDRERDYVPSRNLKEEETSCTLPCVTFKLESMKGAWKCLNVIRFRRRNLKPARAYLSICVRQ